MLLCTGRRPTFCRNRVVLTFCLLLSFTDSEVLAPDFKEKVAVIAKLMQPFVHWWVLFFFYSFFLIVMLLSLNDMMTIAPAGDSDDDEEDNDEETPSG